MRVKVAVAILGVAILVGTSWLLWPRAAAPSVETSQSSVDLKELLLALQICAEDKSFVMPPYRSRNGSSASLRASMVKFGVPFGDPVSKGVAAADTRPWTYAIPERIVGMRWSDIGDADVVVKIIDEPVGRYRGIRKNGELVR